MAKNWPCKCVSNAEARDGRAWASGELVGCAEKDEHAV